MKKGLACLAYSQKYITLYKSTFEKKKKNIFLMRFIIYNSNSKVTEHSSGSI